MGKCSPNYFLLNKTLTEVEFRDIVIKLRDLNVKFNVAFDINNCNDFKKLGYGHKEMEDLSNCFDSDIHAYVKYLHTYCLPIGSILILDQEWNIVLYHQFLQSFTLAACNVDTTRINALLDKLGIDLHIDKEILWGEMERLYRDEGLR